MRPHVARVEAFPLEAPLPDGGYGSSMTRVPARIATLVKITTSDGVTGWGESFGPPRVVAAQLAELAGPLVGQPADVRESFLLENLQLGYHRTTGGLHVAALSGLDIALWDAYARTLGVPVSRLLGGQLRVSPHCWGTGVAQAATLQLLAALPATPFGQTGGEPALLEFDRGYNPLREGVLATPLTFADSCVDVPPGPGLGIEVDEDAVRHRALR